MPEAGDGKCIDRNEYGHDTERELECLWASLNSMKLSVHMQ